MKKQKSQIVLATWPDQKGVRYFGHADLGSYVDGCDSFWLKFRSVNESDSTHWMDDEARAANDMGLYIWFDEVGNLQTYFAIHDCSNLRLNEAESRLKVLRKLTKKMPALRNRNADSFRQALMDIFNAIGVTRAIEYRHMVPSDKSTFIPVYDAVETIGKEFDRRYAIIKKSTDQG